MEWERIEETVEAGRWEQLMEVVEPILAAVIFAGLLCFGMWLEGRL